MHKPMKTGILAGFSLIVVGLLVLGSSIPASAQPKEHPRPLSHILYVGGSGPGNYTTIQDAVDNASDGDTVYVYHGTYNQTANQDQLVQIIHSIHFIGEDKNTTILNGIKGENDVVRVLADNVDMSGFTIQNAGGGLNPGGAIDAYKSNGIGTIKNINIHDNIIAYNGVGLEMYDCSNTACYNNTFLEGGYAYLLECSGNCSIYHNLFIKDKTLSLYIYWISLVDVYGNEFRDNAKGLLYCDPCEGLTIRSNNFINNTIQASFFKEGGFLDLFQLIKTHQNWSQNYWSDWNKTDPRPIRGILCLDLLYYFHPWKVYYPFYFRSYEYDKTPVQVPYPFTIP